MGRAFAFSVHLVDDGRKDIEGNGVIAIKALTMKIKKIHKKNGEKKNSEVLRREKSSMG